MDGLTDRHVYSYIPPPLPPQLKREFNKYRMCTFDRGRDLWCVTFPPLQSEFKISLICIKMQSVELRNCYINMNMQTFNVHERYIVLIDGKY